MYFWYWNFFNIIVFRLAVGVHALAHLLMELQQDADSTQILVADALYQLNRVEEAYRILLCMEHTSSRSPVLARLALLQLHRGFLYDANQVHPWPFKITLHTCTAPAIYIYSQMTEKASCFYLNSLPLINVFFLISNNSLSGLTVIEEAYPLWGH